MRRLALAAVLVLAALAGCDTTAPQPEPQVVVEAYLQAGAPLPTVRVTRTVSANTAYTPDRAAVEGAEVAVQQLDGEGDVAATVSYGEANSAAGLYVPEASVRVEPRATYRLRVTTPGGTEITSTTTVPGAVDLVRTENDTTVYPSDARPEPPQFALTIRPGASTLERQNVYVLTSRSLLDFRDTPPDTLRRLLTPFYAASYDPDTDTLASFRVNSSGLLNEANFTRNDGGTVTVTLPWLAVAFYGPNRISASVVDDNFYDFLRTQSAQQMSLAPGEIPNVIEHVEGGTGIFGSYAQTGASVLIRPPEGTVPD